jgi:hypothetical protein
MQLACMKSPVMYVILCVRDSLVSLLLCCCQGQLVSTHRVMHSSAQALQILAWRLRFFFLISSLLLQPRSKCLCGFRRLQTAKHCVIEGVAVLVTTCVCMYVRMEYYVKDSCDQQPCRGTVTHNKHCLILKRKHIAARPRACVCICPPNLAVLPMHEMSSPSPPNILSHLRPVLQIF